MSLHLTPTLGQVQAAWDAIALRYDAFVTDEDLPFAAQVLDRIEVGSGTRFLDVACGSGAVSIPAARRGAEVTAVDLSPVMVERLGRRARRERLANITGHVMNAEALALPDDAFDVAASQNGVSLLPDPRRGLREIVRVTRPAGRVIIAALGSPRTAEFLAFFLGALQAVMPGITVPAMDAPSLPMQLADHAVLRQGLVDAGLSEVRVDTTSWGMPVTSGRHCWNVVTAGHPIAVQLAAPLTATQRGEVQHVLDGMLRERSGGSPETVLRNVMNIGVGTKPGTPSTPVLGSRHGALG